MGEQVLRVVDPDWRRVGQLSFGIVYFKRVFGKNNKILRIYESCSWEAGGKS